MNRSHLGWLLLTLVLVSILAVGCSAIVVQGSGTPSAGGGAAGKAPGARGGELRLLGSDPPTIDPALAGDTVSSEFVLHAFSGLVKLNERLEVIPELAERWTVSPDGKEYTFKLRDGVKFQNGTPITAETVKFSIERALDPKTGSTTVEAYLSDIAGARAVLEGKAKDVSGIKTPDPQTVVFTLAEPSSYFLSKLTYPTSFVVDRTQLSRPNWFEKPNGTGPFKLTEYKRGDRIVLERNDNYVGATPPALSRVVFYLSGAAITRYENDEIDISPISLIDIDRVRDPKDPLNKQFVETAKLDTSYIGMTVTKAPFDDVQVRRAFNFATDKDRIARVVLRELYTVARGILPPAMPGYSKDIKGLDYDPAKARAELAASKYKDARGLGRIIFSTSGQAASLGPTTEAIIQNWKDNLGVDVEIQQTEYAIYLQDLSANKFQLFEIGWSADYPDPENFLSLLLYSKSSQNTTKFNNPDFDRLIDAARGETDQNKRFEIYRRAEQLAVDQAPWIPLFHSKSYEVVKPYVKGYSPPPMSIEYLSRISIDRK